MTYLLYKRYDLNNIIQNKWTLINDKNIVSKIVLEMKTVCIMFNFFTAKLLQKNNTWKKFKFVNFNYGKKSLEFFKV